MTSDLGTSKGAPVASVDKTIVDRRAGAGSSASRIALRHARQDMQSNTDEPSRYASELLQVHARQLHAARWPLAGLAGALAVAVAPFVNTGGHIALAVWTVLTLGLVAVGDTLATRSLKQVADGKATKTWQSRFGLLQMAHGVGWAVFALIAHPFFTDPWTRATFATDGLPGPVLLGVLLLVGSVHLTVSHTLRGGVAWVCMPAFISLAMLLAPSVVAGRGDASASIVGAAVLTVMFSLLGTRLLTYARGDVRARMEKDDALLGAEEAQNLSDEARRRAEEANMAKTRFLATMSHELRTPLNAILGFSEIMEQEVMGPLGNPKYKEYVADIHSSGAHLLKLINEILDLSRVEAGRYELHEQGVCLATLAGEAMQMVKLKANGKGLTLNLRAEPTLPRVWADERATRQVVLNLLSNAVKFTPTGGEVVVKVGWTNSGGQYVAVCDNGPGIAEEEIPLVLSSFGQGSVALRVAEPGSGLGLPIVQAFMKMHDGRFDLASRLRAGTTATCLFPRKRVMTNEVADAPIGKPRAAFAKAG